MDQDYINIGDAITTSPVGRGVVTGFNKEDYALVNSTAVAWCIRSDKQAYNPRGTGGVAGQLKRGPRPEEAPSSSSPATTEETAMSTDDIQAEFMRIADTSHAAAAPASAPTPAPAEEETRPVSQPTLFAAPYGGESSDPNPSSSSDSSGGADSSSSSSSNDSASSSSPSSND
jgi:hypothetical protein